MPRVSEEGADSMQYLLGQITQGMETVEKAVDALSKDLSQNYVRKSDFELVKKIVYGFVGLILLAFGGGVVALIIPKAGG